MNTCKTCKWWKWDATSIYPEKVVQRLCGSPHVENYDPEGMIDGEECRQVATGPDFGCIHYEETLEQLAEEHPGHKEQLIKRELGPGALRPAQGVPFGQVTHLFNPLTGENEAAVTLPTGTDTSLRREIELEIKGGSHLFLKATKATQ